MAAYPIVGLFAIRHFSSDPRLPSTIGDVGPAPLTKASSPKTRYFARLHTTSLLVPVVVAGLVYLSSSAVSEVMIRF
jgi:hypothetical protein